LVAALTGVKSWISSGANGPDGVVNPFWSKPKGEDGPYSVLDDLHHEVCWKVQRLPSGMTEYTSSGSHHGEVDTSASPTSPTLRIMAQEAAELDARIAADAAAR
jgi:hypothetical protein